MLDQAGGPPIADLSHAWLSDAILAPDRRFVATVGGGRLALWTLDGERLGRCWAGPSDRFLAVSPDGTRLVTGSRHPGAVSIVDTAGSTHLERHVCERKTSASSAAFSSDGRRLLVVWSTEAWLLDGRTGERIASVDGLSDPAQGALSSDGSVIVVSDGVLRAWRVP